MKNTNKVFGLALIVAIGFTALLVTACPGGGGGNDNGGSNNGGTDNG